MRDHHAQGPRLGAKQRQVTLVDQVNRANWPTPRSEDAESCGNHPNAVDSLGGASLLWTTPKVQDTRHATMSASEAKRHEPVLAGQVTLWKTPTESDTNGPGKHGTGGQISEPKSGLWQTPATDSFRSRGGSQERNGTRPASEDSMGNPISVRSEARLPAQAGWDGERARPAEPDDPSDGLFPPGPADISGWRRLLAWRPWAKPAIKGQLRSSIEVARILAQRRAELHGKGTRRQRKQLGYEIACVVHSGTGDARAPESCIHGAFDGSSVVVVVDDDRTDQLRAAGNMVVPLQGATALIVLMKRAGLL